MSYDTGCLDLANKFLVDAKINDEHRRKLAEKLAQGLQDEVEAFLQDENLLFGDEKESL